MMPCVVWVEPPEEEISLPEKKLEYISFFENFSQKILLATLVNFLTKKW